MNLARIELAKQNLPIDGGIRVLAARLGAQRLGKPQAWIFVCNKVGVDVTTLHGWTKKQHDKKTGFAKFNAFYRSKEWTKLRYTVLLRDGRKCALCGATDKLHVDHIKPRSKYPELELEITNLQVLCETCNIGKGGWDETDWRPLALVVNNT